MYYKITLIRPYSEEENTKINQLENVINKKEPFPIYATLSGIISSPETNQEGIFVYRDIVSGEKIYHQIQSERLKGTAYLFYEDNPKEVSISVVKEDLTRLKPHTYNYLISLNEFKRQVIKDYIKENANSDKTLKLSLDSKE